MGSWLFCFFDFAFCSSICVRLPGDVPLPLERQLPLPEPSSGTSTSDLLSSDPLASFSSSSVSASSFSSSSVSASSFSSSVAAFCELGEMLEAAEGLPRRGALEREARTELQRQEALNDGVLALRWHQWRHAVLSGSGERDRRACMRALEDNETGSVPSCDANEAPLKVQASPLALPQQGEGQEQRLSEEDEEARLDEEDPWLRHAVLARPALVRNKSALSVKCRRFMRPCFPPLPRETQVTSPCPVSLPSAASSASLTASRRRAPVGQQIAVVLRLVNPLQLRLVCHQLRLYGTVLPVSSREPREEAESRCSPAEGRTAAARSVEFPSISTVSLEPRQSVLLTLFAIPRAPGRLVIKGLSLELFGFIRLLQPFCLHGGLRPEARFNLRHSHLPSDELSHSSPDVLHSSDGDSQAKLFGEGGSSGAAAASRCASQRDGRRSSFQCLGSWLQFGGAPSDLFDADGNPRPDVPIDFLLQAENYKLLPTGVPGQVLRWKFRNRALEIHEPDYRLEVEVDELLPVLSTVFVGWPSSPIRLLGETTEEETVSFASGESLDPVPSLLASHRLPVVASADPHSPHSRPEVSPASLNGGPLSPETIGPSSLTPLLSPLVSGRRQLYMGEEARAYLLLSSPAPTQALESLSLAVSSCELARVVEAALIFPLASSGPVSSVAASRGGLRATETRGDSVGCEGPSGSGAPQSPYGFERLEVLERPVAGKREKKSRATAGGREEEKQQKIQILRLARKRRSTFDVPASHGHHVGGREASPEEKQLSFSRTASCLMPAGSAIQLSLALRGTVPGIHRVRFCLKGVGCPASEETAGEATETGDRGDVKSIDLRGSDGACSSRRTLWRAIEKVLAVTHSLRLTVQPRLSWRHPGQHLLQCRVRNLTAQTFCVEELAALLPASLGSSLAAASRLARVPVVLVPLSSCGAASLPIIRPYETLELLCLPRSRGGGSPTEGSDLLEAAACASDAVHVRLRWRLLSASRNCTSACARALSPAGAPAGLQVSVEPAPFFPDGEREGESPARFRRVCGVRSASPERLEKSGDGAQTSSKASIGKETLPELSNVDTGASGYLLSERPVSLAPRICSLPLRLTVDVDSHAGTRTSADSPVTRPVSSKHAAGLVPIRFCLTNVSSSLLLGVELFADVSAAGRAAPLRLSPGDVSVSPALLLSPLEEEEERQAACFCATFFCEGGGPEGAPADLSRKVCRGSSRSWNLENGAHKLRGGVPSETDHLNVLSAGLDTQTREAGNISEMSLSFNSGAPRRPSERSPPSVSAGLSPAGFQQSEETPRVSLPRAPSDPSGGASLDDSAPPSNSKSAASTFFAPSALAARRREMLGGAARLLAPGLALVKERERCFSSLSASLQEKVDRNCGVDKLPRERLPPLLSSSRRASSLTYLETLFSLPQAGSESTRLPDTHPDAGYTGAGRVWAPFRTHRSLRQRVLASLLRRALIANPQSCPLPVVDSTGLVEAGPLSLAPSLSREEAETPEDAFALPGHSTGLSDFATLSQERRRSGNAARLPPVHAPRGAGPSGLEGGPPPSAVAGLLGAQVGTGFVKASAEAPPISTSQSAASQSAAGAALSGGLGSFLGAHTQVFHRGSVSSAALGAGRVGEEEGVRALLAEETLSDFLTDVSSALSAGVIVGRTPVTDALAYPGTDVKDVDLPASLRAADARFVAFPEAGTLTDEAAASPQLPVIDLTDVSASSELSGAGETLPRVAPRGKLPQREGTRSERLSAHLGGVSGASDRDGRTAPQGDAALEDADLANGVNVATSRSSPAADVSPEMQATQRRSVTAPECFNGFYWVGKRTQRLGVVRPGEKVEGTLLAFFPSAGVFNVNKVRFRISLLGQVQKRQGAQAPREWCRGGAANDPHSEAARTPYVEVDTRAGEPRESDRNASGVEGESVAPGDLQVETRLRGAPQLLDEERLETEEMQWERELVESFAGQKAVIGFPFECLVHIQERTAG
ncbi:hypothetical protein TGPRC2_214610B [Toxoplasma gondii TgCatPRC2]|uniref:TPPC8 first Ig-like domain-containing protein n=1 Tax=Toxoplasma gondii TgCatPRC2 TaxID=1130821 RepID=A0A151HF24_TOXGO|nr:hypothetical protein TGPRC2_214610B [Toxoplasma gondii TgCatPRC2]